MAKGSVVSIQIAKDAKGDMESLQEVLAVEGKGLEGDRYCNQIGSYSHNPGPDREVTLIEAEAIEAMERDYGVTLDLKDSRRNITTRGVPLNHLLQGREFTVGEVRMRGLRVCEPCANLVMLTGKNVLQGLVHRGGLRAQVLNGGTIRVGDVVEWEPDSAYAPDLPGTTKRSATG
ncbi:MAG: MOSC domain-containing protein [Deltaproteobacteria bacterium]|nr:MOSC domain-containing protein [Deltaproteobacteria bacterium]